MDDEYLMQFDEDATQFTCFIEDDATTFGESIAPEDEAYAPLPEGSIFLERYKIIKVLGQGNFGMIYLLEALDASKKLLVVKEFFPKGFVVRDQNNHLLMKTSLTKHQLKSYQHMQEIFIGEAKNLVKVTEKSHPNIVTFFSLEENKNNTTYFIMNYESGISLKSYLSKREEKEEGRLSNHEIYTLAISLLNGLSQVHSVNVYHQDIKLENILIREDGSPLLLDFGASVILYDEEIKKYFNAATPRYAAIEQINVDQPPKINQTTDIYAIGVLLYRLITQTFPPKSQERLDAISKGHKDPYTPLQSQKLSSYDIHLLKAVDKALKLPQDERFQSAKAFIEGLEHKKKMGHFWVAGILLLSSTIFFLLPGENGKIKLNISEKGYHVYIDGHKMLLDRDKTTSLKAGLHKVIITKDGYLPYEKSIRVKENSLSNLSINLTPMQQVVSIETDADDATIVLNGRTLKSNTFHARHGETYKLKIISKGHETIEKEIDYTTLYQNNFKLYYKLPINRVKTSITVTLPVQMGITKIKVNNEPLRDNSFLAHKGKVYLITITNPYYESLQIERTFQELYENPQQLFTLSQGEGKINFSIHPEDTYISVYQLVEDQEVPLFKKPKKVYQSILISVPASDKLYLTVQKEGYKEIRSRFFSVRNNETVNKIFTLHKNKKKTSSSSLVFDSTPYEHDMIQVPGQSFLISRYEVSYEAFTRFLNASDIAKLNQDKKGHRLYGEKIFNYIMQKPEGYYVSKTYKDYPINYVSWYGAKAYTVWLSKQTSKSYTLPSAQQWRNTAKIGFDSGQVSFQANYHSGVLLQKGLKSPNTLGIYDLFGNVFEWTTTAKGKQKHIIKGGSYRSKHSFLLPQKQSTAYSKNIHRKDLGFRIIK